MKKLAFFDEYLAFSKMIQGLDTAIVTMEDE